MLIALIIINIVLIAVTILLLVSKPRGGGFDAREDAMRDIELLEFQQNMKELIADLNKVAENGANSMEIRKKELERVIQQADARVKELKYLIDRNKVIRDTEYKSEIAMGPGESAAPQAAPQAAPVPAPKAAAKPKEEENGAKFVIAGQDAENPSKNKPKDKYSNIQGLLSQGMSIDEISKVTGLSKGEIELIKNLKKR